MSFLSREASERAEVDIEDGGDGAGDTKAPTIELKEVGHQRSAVFPHRK